MKVVVKLEFDGEKIKQKTMKAISGVAGVESIALDPKEKKLTVIGNVDPVVIVEKLRKLCRTDIISIGPVKEPEKKGDEGKKEGPKGNPTPLMNTYPPYLQTPYYSLQYQSYQQTPVVAPPLPYYNRSVEEYPNNCVIC